MFSITVENSVIHVTLKNEDAWCEVLGDFRSQIRFSPETIRWTVAQKTFRTTTAQPERQPLFGVLDLERRRGQLELQLARQQPQREQPLRAPRNPLHF